MDQEKYFNHLLSLLKLEREEDRKQYLLKIRNKSIADRRKQGVSWYPVIIDYSKLGLGERWKIKVERVKGIGDRHLFQVGASVSLFLQTDKKGLSSSGVITRMGENTITFMLNKEDPPSWISEGKLGLDLLFDESTYDEMEKAMKMLSQVKKGRVSDLIQLVLGKSDPQFGKTGTLRYPYLNNSQNLAINKVLAAKDLALIHGPPGTGKTTTLAHAIKEIASHEKQVLVCAPSNAAVDLLVQRLHVINMNVVRLGHPARVTENVIIHTLDSQLATHTDARLLRDLRRRAEEMRSLGLKYKSRFGRDERMQRKLLLDESRLLKEEALALEDHMIDHVLNKAEVITCTLIGANQKYLRNKLFKTVFIDESTQALEPACWIPMIKAQRVIMAGDHQQLPPTIKSREAATGGLESTIFQKCIDQFDVDSLLEMQYRMDPAIMAFSNNYFYDGKLKSSESVLQRGSLFNPAVEFVDTAGCGFFEELNTETLSTYNTEEAHLVLRLLEFEIEQKPEVLDESSIGIIAPYKAQVELLNRLIRENNILDSVRKNITINTVDAFQGQERDLIFITLVRSNDRREIGFLANYRRMNVAMTRARHKLTMVGDSATLANDPFYDKMITYFQQKEYYKSAFEYI